VLSTVIGGDGLGYSTQATSTGTSGHEVLLPDLRLGSMPRVVVNGTELFFEVDGEGAPCVVLHGGLGVDHTLYRRTLRPLSPPMRLIYFDHRCNGRSGRPPLDTLTMEQLADDTCGLADHLGLDRFHVLGHSYGGFVAQELATKYPDRVAGLLLVSTTAGQLGNDESAHVTEQGPAPPPEVVELMSAEPATDDDLAVSMDQMLPHHLHRRDIEEVRSLLADTVWSANAMKRGFEVLSTWSSVDRLDDISCPTLVIVGRHDIITSFPQAHRIARRVRDANVEVLDQSGHFPWLDEPDMFFPLVHGWLARD
jgi:proline iminopeptidase